MAGFGRTGQWLALDAFDVRPDLITFAKGVNSGYVPVGGVIISDEIAHAFDERVFPGGLTYSGHPLAAASIVAAQTAMAEEGVVDNAARIGTEVFGPGLAELADKHAVIGEVRGVGVVLGHRAGRRPGHQGAAAGRAAIGGSRRTCWAAACCPSPPTTGSTSSRRATSPTTTPGSGWRSSTRRSTAFRP